MVTRDRTLLWTTLAGSASTALYAALALAGNLPERLGAYLAVHFLLFGIYAALLVRIARRPAQGEDAPEEGTGPAGRRRPITAGLLLFGFAALFRLLLVATPPSLSDDIHRYVWDGRVQAAGINPFLHPPDSEELRALRDEGWSKVNHPAIRTIYPPLAQGVFALAAAGGLRERGFKAVLCLFDLAVVVALAWFLRTDRPLPAAGRCLRVEPARGRGSRLERALRSDRASCCCSSRRGCWRGGGSGPGRRRGPPRSARGSCPWRSLPSWSAVSSGTSC